MILLVGVGSLGGAFFLEIRARYPRELVHVVDMDIVESDNLSRHPIFTKEDVQRYKAEAIAERFDSVVAHTQRIEEVPCDFFAQFQIIFCAVDNLSTRRWLNWVLHDQAIECIFIEPGCEGKVAHARIFRPLSKRGPCIECTLGLYARDEETLPLCGLPSKLTSLEMCVQWASARNPTFDIDKTVELAQRKAIEFGFDPSLISREFCEKVLNRTVPTDPETNLAIARFALSELLDYKYGEHLFLNIYSGHSTKHILAPSDSECNICW